jgi:uncharacterized membrane protein (DUF4010 family)
MKLASLRRPGVASAVVGLSLACLIIAVLLAGHRDWAAAAGLAASAVGGLAGSAVYLRGQRRRP